MLGQFYIYCYFQSSQQSYDVGMIHPSVRKPKIRGLVIIQGHAARKRWPPDVRPGSYLLAPPQGPDLISSSGLLQHPPPLHWDSPLRVHHSEFGKHWTRSMCLSVWMCFLSHCLSLALGVRFSEGTTPGSLLTSTEWRTDTHSVPSPSPGVPIPGLTHTEQPWTFWELQAKKFNSWEVGNYD